MEKLKSRKFWICVAAALASLGTSIAGIATSNEVIAAFGVVCTCGEIKVKKYLSRISSRPLQDRIDIVSYVDELTFDELSTASMKEESAD